MCGIAGIFAHHAAAAPVSAGELVACRDHMAARGPDAHGLWLDEAARIGLAHRRLSIIDLDQRSSQPMHTTDGGLVIVFNGEIYNYQELRGELQQKGVAFRTTSDTEVLLHLYRDCGEQMVDRLRGMFAFAIWDVRARELFLARDPYGIKPLYYADDGKTFRFASQVRALMAGGGIASAPSAAGWAGFYLFGSVPEPYTTFEAVRSLPAGCTMRVTPHGIGEVQRYFSIGQAFRTGAAAAAERVRPEQEVLEEARSALLESVRYHMVADVPVGAFLSGGIDSGALVGLMRDAGQNDIQTMTLSFEEFAGHANDEAPIAAEVARSYGTRHTRRIVTEQEFRADLPLILAAMDQPTIDGLNTWFIAKTAKEIGLKVVVSGLGGDELIGGYPSFRQMPRLVRWLAPMAQVPMAGRTLRRALQMAGPTRFGINAKTDGIAELGGTYPGAYLLRRGLFMPWELDAVMPRETVRQGLDELAPIDLIGREIGSEPSSGFARVATLESSLYMRNQLLRDTDWTSMAHSLEARVPLVDRHLLERLALLPLGSPAYSGKRLLRSAPGQPLPRSVWDKPKTGFTTPINSWIRNLPSLAPSTLGKSLDGQHWSRRWALEVKERFVAQVAVGPAGTTVLQNHGAAA